MLFLHGFSRATAILIHSLLRHEGAPLAATQILPSRRRGKSAAMLEMAAQPGGTASQAQVPGYRVAGKTGTAHKPKAGQYAKKYVSSFVGFAPASDPRLVIA